MTWQITSTYQSYTNPNGFTVRWDWTCPVDYPERLRAHQEGPLPEHLLGAPGSGCPLQEDWRGRYLYYQSGPMDVRVAITDWSAWVALWPVYPEHLDLGETVPGDDPHVYRARTSAVVCDYSATEVSAPLVHFLGQSLLDGPRLRGVRLVYCDHPSYYYNNDLDAYQMSEHWLESELRLCREAGVEEVVHRYFWEGEEVFLHHRLVEDREGYGLAVPDSLPLYRPFYWPRRRCVGLDGDRTEPNPIPEGASILETYPGWWLLQLGTRSKNARSAVVE